MYNGSYARSGWSLFMSLLVSIWNSPLVPQSDHLIDIFVGSLIGLFPLFFLVFKENLELRCNIGTHGRFGESAVDRVGK